MRRFIFLFLIIFANSIQSLELPEPYRSIEVLPFDPQGWYGNANSIQKIFSRYPIKTVIEVGSWIGASTRHIASLLPNEGKVYAVDHWLGSAEHQSGNENWTPAMEHLYQQFLSNVIHSQLTDKIIPMRMSSKEAALALKVKPDLVYIDATHETEAVYNDLKIWFPFVKGHGILCGDDWTWPTVAAAVRTFAQENNLRLETDDNFWIFYEN